MTSIYTRCHNSLLPSQKSLWLTKACNPRADIRNFTLVEVKTKVKTKLLERPHEISFKTNWSVSFGFALLRRVIGY